MEEKGVKQGDKSGNLCTQQGINKSGIPCPPLLTKNILTSCLQKKRSWNQKGEAERGS